MRAHVINESGLIENTIMVDELGEGMIDAAIGGEIGDSYIDGVIVKKSIPTPEPVVVVPQSVTRKQARLALLAAGHFYAVHDGIESLEEPIRTEAKINWDDSDTYARDNPFVAMMAQMLGLSNSDVDDLFVAAAKF